MGNFWTLECGEIIFAVAVFDVVDVGPWLCH